MLKSILSRTARAVLPLAATALIAGAASAADPIKIGTFLSVTGPASFLGDPELKTLQMYVEKINANGGVLGRKLELVHYDAQHQAKSAVTFTKRLIEQDKVDIIVGGSTSGQTMAVVKLVEKAGMPFISLAGAAVIVDPVKKWVFKTPHTDRLAARKIFSDMKKRGLSKLGVLSGAGGFDKSCRKSVTSIAPSVGIEIVADETHGKGDTDMTPQLTKIKNAPGVQAMVYCGFGAATSIEARNYKQLGMKIAHYHSHGSGSMKFIKGADGAAEGVRLPAAALLVVDALPDDNKQKAVAGAYRTAYETRFKDSVSTFGGHAYDGLMIAVQAMERAGSTDKAKVRDEIEKTKNYIGADGIYTMSPTDHMGLDEDSFVMVEVKNGTWAMAD
ncbi:MAG: ABC transporter substrate-binding protein [Hyphomicrobiales bacterium]|mgnify:FL=1|nr:MAG: ABC transporter substrate-binding protein [Hyphomicrobiales bacterium]